MSWWLLLGIACLVFANRYILLEPRIQVPIPLIMRKMLKHAAPHLMLVLCVPIILMEGGELRSSILDPYILAAAFCILLTFRRTKLLSNFVLTLGLFYLLLLFF